jgi:hypothetical protein
VRFGLYEHVQLAVTLARLNLGVVWTHSFARSPESLGLSQDRSTLAIEDKESYRWLQGYRIACELQGECPETQVVSIADREGDIYDIYVEHRDHIGPRADFLIRARLPRSTDRSTIQKSPSKMLAHLHFVMVAGILRMPSAVFVRS